MTKPIIAVDIDDVLTQGVDSFRKEINRQIGSNLSLADYMVPDGSYTGYFARVWARHGIADKIDLDALNAQMVKSQTHVVPAEGAARVLTYLSNRFDLIIVTDRPVEWKPATLAWLEQYYPNMFQKVLFRREIAESKGVVCKQEGVNWLLDDNMMHAQTAIDQEVSIVLFGDYGWHEHVPKSVVRCKNWQAVKEFFDGRND